jgi:putative DNA primase/helicase
MTFQKAEQEFTLSNIGQSLIETYHFKTLRDTKEILYFSKKGKYEFGGEEVVEQTVRAQIDRNISKHDLAEVLYFVRTSTYVDRADFDADPHILNVANGLLDVETGILAPHTFEYLSMSQTPANYDPKATCRPIIEALYNTFEDPTDVPLFLEWVGYNLLWGNKELQKEVMMIGPPECGKSKILDTMIMLLGSENVSAITFQQLSSNRFALAQLFNKKANIYADISHVKVEDIERFKAVATADEVEAEKKGMQLFKFRPVAKQTYSCNIPPRPPINVDDSFYRRWILVKCAWREGDYFTGAERVRDRRILEKLATPENLSGLMRLAIISAKRLQERGRFCKELPTDQIREEYDRLANPVKLWIEECCEDREGDEDVTKQEAHQSYVKFCKARNIAPLNEVWLGKELTILGYTERQVGNGKNKKRLWNGLKLKEIPAGNQPFPSLIEQNVLSVQVELPLPGGNPKEGIAS